MKRCPEGMGAYSSSKGLLLVREAVAAFLEKRDDQPADPEHIFLTAGASEGIKTVLSMVIRDQSDGKSCCLFALLQERARWLTRNARRIGILIPIPQYPLYSAAITSYGGTQLGYNATLSDDGVWG